MKTIIMLMCLIPSIAFAEVRLTFRDGSIRCGNYELKGSAYCGADNTCWNVSDMVAIKVVDGCGAVGEKTKEQKINACVDRCYSKYNDGSQGSPSRVYQCMQYCYHYDGDDSYYRY